MPETDRDAFPAIEELVGLLKKLDPRSLAVLRQEYRADANSEVDELLSPGKMMGKKSNDTIKRWEIAAKATTKALRAAVRQCTAQMSEVSHSIRRARRWQIAAQGVGLVGTASIWTVLGSDLKFAFTARNLAAVFTLAGALVALVARSIGEAPLTGKSWVEGYRSLSAIEAEAEQLANTIERQVKVGTVGSDIGPLLDRSELLAIKLKQLLRDNVGRVKPEK